MMQTNYMNQSTPSIDFAFADSLMKVNTDALNNQTIHRFNQQLQLSVSQAKIYNKLQYALTQRAIQNGNVKITIPASNRAQRSPQQQKKSLSNQWFNQKSYQQKISKPNSRLQSWQESNQNNDQFFEMFQDFHIKFDVKFDQSSSKSLAKASFQQKNIQKQLSEEVNCEDNKKKSQKQFRNRKVGIFVAKGKHNPSSQRVPFKSIQNLPRINNCFKKKQFQHIQSLRSSLLEEQQSKYAIQNKSNVILLAKTIKPCQFKDKFLQKKTKSTTILQRKGVFNKNGRQFIKKQQIFSSKCYHGLKETLKSSTLQNWKKRFQARNAIQDSKKGQIFNIFKKNLIK